MGLEIIGAGFGRTGTDSMKQALEMLGYDPCYHMYEVLPHQDRVDMWRAAAAGDPPDWDVAFAGYRATVDWPGAFYWRELAAHFPNAKILLTTRSSESWYASMAKTIIPVMRDSDDPGSLASKMLAERVFGGDFEDRNNVIAAYERNIAEVQSAFGPERLLTFTVGDGWAPLCAFLGRPVPDASFPHSNQPGEFAARLDSLEKGRLKPPS